MLRTCILLCGGFFSFAVNADNPVPVNIFGSIPANVVSPVPANAASHIPTSTVSYVPANAASHIPTSTVSYVPANAASHIPTSTVSYVPANATSHIPTSTVSYVPANAASHIPTSTVSYVPANATSHIPTSTVSPVPTNVNSSIWLLVDTKAHKIEVKKGELTLETLDGIAIGRKGAGLKGHRGDDITPYGNYRVGWVGEKSKFRKFFGLTYPSKQDAEIALKRGIISESDYYSIVAAEQYNQIPPQNTPLGGQIGIHGLGAGDERVHQAFDWTHGCIALTNSQIDHLSQWLDTGTVVKIK
jgi:L,D-peptidoglycan transpeptidase YkuD (ErfK/YbiS/YcfS/YnhG family)